MNLLLVLLACDRETPAPDPLDLTLTLGADEVRAGAVTQAEALWGGIAAEGALGDYKIYNDRVRFLIQAPKPSGYYFQQGGAVVDADLVRPAGQPGRDLVDDWVGMFGIARVQAAETVRVLDDGVASGRAVIRVEGPEGAMGIAEGALGNDDLVPDLGLQIRTDYILEPGAWWMRVETTLTATDDDATFAPGDLLIGSLDAGSRWLPGTGLDAPDADTLKWAGFIGNRNEAALAIVPEAGAELQLGGAASLLSALVEADIGFGDTVTLSEGESVTYSRYYAVTPDLATLTDAWLALNGEDTETVAGVVTAPDGPVAGAWVGALLDGAPFTCAITDEAGAYSFEIPAGSAVELVVSGQGPGLYPDLPPGAAHYSSYAPEPSRAAALASLRDGATPIPLAEGRGVSTDGSSLAQPGILEVSSADGLPFEVRVAYAGGEPAGDARLVPRAPSGYAAIGWGRDGSVRFPLPPGDYDVLVHRGLRWEFFEAAVQLEAGETAQLSATLSAAYTLEDWIIADPHSHAAPSTDGSIPMEDRLVVQASTGVALHFGTDHDHIADYRPLIEVLGLSSVMNTVVADEVSPVLRGHVNAYPLEPQEGPNGGAWLWWEEPVDTTSEQMAALRAKHEGVVLQLNHPLDSGVGEAAGWSPGVISDGSKWTEDFDAVEVLNSGDYVEYFNFYLDLVARGVVPTPVGVTDSHSHTGGRPGLNVTFLHMDADPAAYTPDALRSAMAARATIVSRGPFLEMSISPGAVFPGATSLEVRALSPSWIQVDRLILLENGLAVETVQGAEATFALSPAADAFYVVVAEGDSDMAPVWPGQTPWAASSAIRIDANMDGAWTPPLPPLSVP